MDTQNIYEKHTKKLTIFSISYKVRLFSLEKPSYGYQLQELSVWEPQIASEGHFVNRYLKQNCQLISSNFEKSTDSM